MHWNLFHIQLVMGQHALTRRPMWPVQIMTRLTHWNLSHTAGSWVNIHWPIDPYDPSKQWPVWPTEIFFTLSWVMGRHTLTHVTNWRIACCVLCTHGFQKCERRWSATRSEPSGRWRMYSRSSGTHHCGFLWERFIIIIITIIIYYATRTAIRKCMHQTTNAYT